MVSLRGDESRFTLTIYLLSNIFPLIVQNEGGKKEFVELEMQKEQHDSVTGEPGHSGFEAK